jgi:serine/threonine protein kinase
MVPERIGPYRVIRRCGAGGMGEVYLAQDTRLDRFVALKFLSEEFTRDAARRQRFFSEARAAAALAHPHICTVYDVAETEDARPYIAMEWLEGPTLRERLKGAPLPLDELLEIGLQVAEALEAAHARGLVHRDVKPGNVSLSAGGQVKVLDFGLAKWLQPQLGAMSESRTTVLQTESGQILGTPGYMSPEQTTGKPVDQRSDLFSLGVMLYEMATGRVPFGGSDWAEILRGIAERQPEPMVRFNSEVPTELERIVMKCLQKAPGERYQSASELRIDLAALQASLAAPKSTASGPLVTFLCLEVPEALRLKGSGRLQAAAELTRQEQDKLQKLLSGPEGRVEAVGDVLLARCGRPSEAVQVALRMVSESGAACRLGLHLGEVLEPGQAEPLRRYGAHLETAVRLMQLAEPGHILMSRGVFDSARVVVKREEVAGPGALSWVSHGPYEFAGLEEPLEVCEVGFAGRGLLSAPKTTQRAKRQVRSDEEPVLGWRPAVGQEVPNTKWVLEEKLGEGGFGEVWNARHETLKEQHVFKFCFRADRVRSLKREVTLFRLMKERVGEHPNVVRLYDVYFDQPPFYLEEEYVPGKDLKTWCEAQAGADKVPLEIRLEIVAQAAEALQAAHDAGVIHRDVKPGNILVSGHWPVTSGQKEQPDSPLTARPPALTVKLTDFGIGQVVSAEALAGVTKAGFTQTMMSPSSSYSGTHAYMAPELLMGKPASTRSDIYSLGVVLYQLLAADFKRPVTTDWAEDVLDSLLRDDLQHCFAGKPEDRFSGVAQLSRNLRALPARRAALARQQAERAALEKAAYRRGIVRAAAIASVIIVLVSALAGVAIHQSRRAQSEAATAQRVSDFLIELFRVSDPGEARGNTITAREILDRGAKRIELELTNQPLVQAKLMHTMGRVYRSLGLQAQAQPLLEKALRIRRELLGENHLDYADSLTTLANVLWDKADYASAKPMFERALAIREKALGPDDPQVATSCHNLGNLFLLQGDYTAARRHFQRALAIREKSLGSTHAEVGNTLNSLGAVEYRLGNLAQARSIWERSLAIREQTLGTNHYLVAMTCNNLGLLHKDMGDLAQAKALLLKAIRIQEKVLGPAHSDLASGLHNLGDVLRRAGDVDEARVTLQRAIRIRESASGPDHPELARIVFSLAELEREAGNYAVAKPLYDRALAIQQKARPDNSETEWYVAGLANLNRDQGNRVEAEQLYKRVLQGLEKTGAAETSFAGEIYRNIGRLYQAWGRTTEAGQFYQHSLTILEKAYGSDHADVKSLRQCIAEVSSSEPKPPGQAPSPQKP